MLLTIPRNELTIDIIVPNDIKIKYFDTMYGKKPLYVCVLMDKNNVPRVYTEKGFSKEIDGIVKVFFEKKDVNSYINKLLDERTVSEDTIKYWESNYEDLVKMLIKIDKTNREKHGKGIRGVTCAVIGLHIVNIDVFWTNEKNLMV